MVGVGSRVHCEDTVGVESEVHRRGMVSQGRVCQRGMVGVERRVHNGGMVGAWSGFLWRDMVGVRSRVQGRDTVDGWGKMHCRSGFCGG